MKKKILIASIVSIVLNMILFCINLISANMFHNLLFAKAIPGGECTEYIGFGVNLLKIYLYPMTAGGSISVSYHVGFNLISLIISIILVFLLTFIILILIDKLRKKKNVWN